MKAQNYKEVRSSYIIFLAYFTILLSISVLCWHLSIVTESAFISNIELKREEVNAYKNQNSILNNRIDSINTLMSMLNTQMVTNEDALEKKILQLKNESLNEIEQIESTSNYNYSLYKKALGDIEKILDAKKSLQQNKAEEEISKMKLQDCNNANIKLRNRK